MTETITLTVPVAMKHLHLVAQLGVQMADSVGPPRVPGEHVDFSGDVELALSEAFTNAVKHAPPSGSSARVIIEFSVGPGILTVAVKDRNPPFDPDVAPLADITTYPSGGFGVFLMKQVMDTVGYRRESGWNVITLSKLLKLD